MHRKPLKTLLSWMTVVSIATAEIPDPDIFDGSLQTTPQHNAPHHKPPPPTAGDKETAPQASPAAQTHPQIQPAASNDHDTAGAGPQSSQPATTSSEKDLGASGQPTMNTTSPQQAGSLPPGSDPQGAVDLSIFQRGTNSQSKSPRVLSPPPQGSQETPIEVPADFERLTSLQGVLNEIEQQRANERKKVIQQIENNPNHGSEVGTKLPSDL